MNELLNYILLPIDWNFWSPFLRGALLGVPGGIVTMLLIFLRYPSGKKNLDKDQNYLLLVSRYHRASEENSTLKIKVQILEGKLQRVTLAGARASVALLDVECLGGQQ